MRKSTGIVIFMFGVAVGYATAWRYTKRKYEQIAQEEIASVKETFSGRKANDISESGDAKARMARQKLDISEYTTTLHNCGYTNYSNADDKKQEKKLHVISPDEFGELDEYDKISLIYYDDDVLTDDDDEPVDKELVGGEGALNSFGEYEDDAVFVRNDLLKCDYEILRDKRKYSDVVKTMPHSEEYE